MEVLEDVIFDQRKKMKCEEMSLRFEPMVTEMCSTRETKQKAETMLGHKPEVETIF